MSIYHCSIKIIGRSRGRSAVASAAYRSGTKLYSEETNKTFNYTKKGGVIYSEIMLCENAPVEFEDREVLWNEVQKIEKNGNAQLAREVEIALPKEFSRNKQIEVIREYVKCNFVDKGMCADWALHDKENGNPHAHIMLTTRPIKKGGKWGDKKKNGYKLDKDGNKIPKIDPKTGQQKIEAKTGRKVWERATVESTDWNKREKAEEWRKSWADICNQYLASDKQIDYRSYERQGKDIIPTIHEGTTARKIEKSGRIANRCEMNREIKKANTEIKQIKKEVVNNEIERIREEIEGIREQIQAESRSQAEGDTSITERIKGLIDRIRKRVTEALRKPIKPVEDVKTQEEVYNKKPPERSVMPSDGLIVDLQKEIITITYQGKSREEPLFSSNWGYDNLIKEYAQKHQEEQELIKKANRPKELQQQINDLEIEKNKLKGIFKGKEKKRIEEQISELNAQLGYANGQAELAEKELSGLQGQRGSGKAILIQLQQCKQYALTHKSNKLKQTVPAAQEKEITVTDKKDFDR